MTPDYARLDDLVEFARIEVAANDLEPWAEVLGWLYRSGNVGEEEALWLISLYNTYDSLGSAFAVAGRWPTPLAWATAPDADGAADYECTQERRNLRGGKVLRRLDSYVGLLAGQSQYRWLGQPVRSADPHENWLAMLAHLRKVWGVGRQSSFEWAEFLQKCVKWNLSAPDADLWESEGPRRSIQRLYGGDKTVSLAWLNEHANHCRDYLTERGVALTWEDFETVICDFNVMRDGRYYPGRHLAALREEIDSLTDDTARAMLNDAWAAVVPADWQAIPPGIDPNLMPVYRNTGKLVMPV